MSCRNICDVNDAVPCTVLVNFAQCQGAQLQVNSKNIPRPNKMWIDLRIFITPKSGCPAMFTSLLGVHLENRCNSNIVHAFWKFFLFTARRLIFEKHIIALVQLQCGAVWRELWLQFSCRSVVQRGILSI